MRARSIVAEHPPPIRALGMLRSFRASHELGELFGRITGDSGGESTDRFISIPMKVWCLGVDDVKVVNNRYRIYLSTPPATGTLMMVMVSPPLSSLMSRLVSPSADSSPFTPVLN